MLFLAVLLHGAVANAQTNGKMDITRRWLDTDVQYIITPTERDTFLTLKTESERESFVNNFWARRDPEPRTAENEFRDEYYKRVAFANEHFTSGIRGWKTDRGGSYIQLGKPDNIETGRAEFEGIKSCLFERWSYKADSSGCSLELIFVDPTETKEYRFLMVDRAKILEDLAPKGLRTYIGGGTGKCSL